MKLWIARDGNGTLWFHKEKPIIKQHPTLNYDYWSSKEDLYEIDMDFLPEVTFENSPQEVELKLIEK